MYFLGTLYMKKKDFEQSSKWFKAVLSNEYNN